MSTTEAHRLLELEIPEEFGAASDTARKVGIDAHRLSRIRAGQVPGIDVLVKFRDSLGIPLDAWAQPPKPVKRGRKSA